LKPEALDASGFLLVDRFVVEGKSMPTDAERAYWRACYHRNKDKKNAATMKWRTKNPENQAKHDAANNRWRAKHPGIMAKYQKAWLKRDPQNAMLVKTKSHAKAIGVDFSLTKNDVIWSTHCPVLGVELRYDQLGLKSERYARPTLDRWDATKGYVPGNVFVISWKANMAKSNLTADQLEALARYARHGTHLTLS
jgi:hypothetical protein